MSVSIFISGVSDEFGAYREALRRKLTRHNVEIKVQEDFKNYGRVALDKLDLYISHCDAVVHLVGDMTGADAEPVSVGLIRKRYPDIAAMLPPLREALNKGLGISFTQWEAWLAIYHNKVLLIAQADVVAPRGPNYRPSEASRAAQRKHLERLRAVGCFPGEPFTGLDNLAYYIAINPMVDLLAEERRDKAPRRPPVSGQALLHLLSGNKELAKISADEAVKGNGADANAMYVRGMLKLQNPINDLSTKNANDAEHFLRIAAGAGLGPQCAVPRIALRIDHYRHWGRDEPAPTISDLVALYRSHHAEAVSWPYGLLNLRLPTSDDFKLKFRALLKA